MIQSIEKTVPCWLGCQDILLGTTTGWPGTEGRTYRGMAEFFEQETILVTTLQALCRLLSSWMTQRCISDPNRILKGMGGRAIIWKLQGQLALPECSQDHPGLIIQNAIRSAYWSAKPAAKNVYSHIVFCKGEGRDAPQDPSIDNFNLVNNPLR